MKGGIMPGGRDVSPHVDKRQTNGEVQPSIYDDLKFEDRFYEKLQNSSGQEVANNYFRNKRAEKLLSNPTENSRVAREPSPNLISPSFSNGYVSGGSPNGSWGNNNRSPPSSSGLRAAQVHGTLNGEDIGVRKPLRLQSLPQASSGKHSKKKKKQFNTMEQL